MSDAGTVTHLRADLAGVGSGALRDAPLLSGLLIAAASAGGLNVAAAPVVRTGADGGVAAILLLEPSHLSVHTFPDRGIALVDVLARDDAAAAKALDVFVRRLLPATVERDTRVRG
ncbi:MAG TPA: S-adenosylmethionine decarboxylase [Gemmatimonadaceae bacterium]|nr:S-adenosylmethionine decarboxylase [Gemmatimonadaceae bacterium]